jgi:hypothetical protein
VVRAGGSVGKNSENTLRSLSRHSHIKMAPEQGRLAERLLFKAVSR